jgi:hypothetical protein
MPGKSLGNGTRGARSDRSPETPRQPISHTAARTGIRRACYVMPIAATGVEATADGGGCPSDRSP